MANLRWRSGRGGRGGERARRNHSSAEKMERLRLDSVKSGDSKGLGLGLTDAAVRRFGKKSPRAIRLKTADIMIVGDPGVGKSYGHSLPWGNTAAN